MEETKKESTHTHTHAHPMDCFSVRRCQWKKKSYKMILIFDRLPLFCFVLIFYLFECVLSCDIYILGRMHARTSTSSVSFFYTLSLFVCGSRGREREREKLDEKLMMILFPAFPFIYYIFISVLREYFGANNCDIYTCPVCVHTNRR